MCSLIEFLILLSLVLLSIEIIISTGGILAFSGIVSFFLGFFIMLIFKVKIPHLFLMITIPTFIVLLVLSIIIIILAYKAQKKKPIIGENTLIGKTGICKKPIQPGKNGIVEIDGELWTAFSDENINEGERVVVTNQESLKLKVKRGV